MSAVITDAVIDRVAVAELLDRFIVALDQPDFDDTWLRSIATDDVRFEFPLGVYEGVDGLADFLKRPMAVFERTHHLCSKAVVDLESDGDGDGDRATLTANMIATHMHAPDHVSPAGGPGPMVLFGAHMDGQPRQIVVIGTHMDGAARRTPDGWRLQRLAFRMSWLIGDPPPATKA